jgi:gamma-glutamyltranspeptidase/glutathione hydrolase
MAHYTASETRRAKSAEFDAEPYAGSKCWLRLAQTAFVLGSPQRQTRRKALGKTASDRLFEPAIRYAESGFPVVSPETASRASETGRTGLSAADGAEFQPLPAGFFLDLDRTQTPEKLVHSPLHAKKH